MHEQMTTAMFALIRKVVCGAEISRDVKESLSSELLPSMYTLSKSHDLAHIVAQGLSELSLLSTDEISQKFQKQQLLAVYRYQRLHYELEQVCQAFTSEGIPFIPLKGSVLRPYYPEPWMRTSCDIDVLVREEDLEKASRLLEEKLAYQSKGKGSHDVSFFSPSGVHIELHYNTVEEGRANQANRILSTVWKHAAVQAEDSSAYALTDAMFYFYHIAHMAKHFEEGGCGIRPFLDLWILEHRVSHDQKARDRLLEQGGLLPFANACRRLSAAWFDGAKQNKITQQMQAYVLHGGVYGSLNNRVAVYQNKKGGKLRYALSRIFLPYETLKFHYPILQKHKWLTPIMEIRRWFKLLFKGKIKRSLHELNVNKTISQEKVDETADLLNQLGLE